MSAPSATDLAARLAGGVWGHLIGDAVGVPYEFRQAVPPDSIRFGATGSHGQPPGTWSDDGSMMLALLDSLLEASFDLEDQGRRIVAWYRHKAYTPDGDGAFDVGNTTRAAISALESGTPAERAGGTDEYSNGNGSLMRILPIALAYGDRDDAELVVLAHRASAVTHGTARAMVACALYCLIAKRLLHGSDRGDALANARTSLREVYGTDRGYVGALDHLERYADRGGRGRVWDSFWSAWEAYEGAGSYEATIKRAIAYGHDTDTTAAIAGGLAGIYWTVDGIPREWVAGMRGHDVVEPMVDRLLQTRQWRTSTNNPIQVHWVDLSTVPALRESGGRLGLTFLPGKQRDGWGGLHWRNLDWDVKRLREEYRADAFLLLVEDQELRDARVAGIEGAFQRHGIELVRFPVVDEAIPTDRAAFGSAIKSVVAKVTSGSRVVVACRGGLGRTGLAVACALVTAGLGPQDAIDLTQATRKHTITNRDQQRFVHRWSAR